MIKHAWYSNKQFKIISNKHILRKNNNMEINKPYIYYKDINNKIIQVTQITNDLDHHTLFNDIKYLGEVIAFYKISSEPMLFKS